MTEFTPGERVRVTMVLEGMVIQNGEHDILVRAKDGSFWRYFPASADVTVEKIDG